MSIVTEQEEFSQITAILGENVEFNGYLSYEGTVRIDGKFSGDIKTTGCLIVTQSATIEAEVHVGHLLLVGELKGNVVSSGKVEIAPTGRLLGDLVSGSVVVKEGGIIQGKVKSGDAREKVIDISEGRKQAGERQAVA